MNTPYAEPVEASPACGESVDDPRSRYRAQLLSVLRAIRANAGDRAGIEAVLDTLIALEELELELLGSQETHISEEEEIALAELHHPNGPPPTLNRLLGIAGARIGRRIRARTDEEDLDAYLARLGIPVRHTPDVLLPPDAPLNLPQGADRKGEHARRRVPRTQHLLGRLAEEGIALDELSVLFGALRKGQMRRSSYAVVTVPSYGGQLIVCDEVGERTFVSREIHPDAWYAERSKLDLQHEASIQSTLAHKETPDGWKRWGDHTLAILRGDVSRERILAALRNRYPTAEAWLGMSLEERVSVEVNGLKYHALGMLLGRKKFNVCSTRDHLAFAEALYGADDPAVVAAREALAFRASPEAVRAAILAQYPTAEAWLAIPLRARRDLSCRGRKYHSLGIALAGTHFDAFVNRDHLAFAEVLYGADDPAIVAAREALAFRASPEAVRAAILAQYPTAEAWLGMSTGERQRLSCNGLKYHALGNALTSTKVYPHLFRDHLAFAEALYGADDPAVVAAREALAFRASPEAVRAAILAQYPTAEAWLGMSLGNRSALRCYELKYIALGKALVGKDLVPHVNRDHVRFAEALYGADDPAVSAAREGRSFAENPEAIRAAIRAMYPTAEAWLGLSSDGRAALSCNGLKYVALGNRLTNARLWPDSNRNHIRLAAAIYGADDPAVVAARSAFKPRKRHGA